MKIQINENDNSTYIREGINKLDNSNNRYISTNSSTDIPSGYNLNDGLKFKRFENLISYQIFCSETDPNILDIAFGKNNVIEVSAIGKQMAMYAWYVGLSKTIYLFENLSKCDSLSDITSNGLAYDEYISVSVLVALVNKSPYASSILNTLPFDIYRRSREALQNVLDTPGKTSLLRDTPGFLDVFNEDRIALTNIGTNFWTVPLDIKQNWIFVQMVGGGGDDIFYNAAPNYAFYSNRWAGGGAGQYRNFILSVTPGQEIKYSINAGANTIFGDYVALKGIQAEVYIISDGVSEWVRTDQGESIDLNDPFLIRATNGTSSTYQMSFAMYGGAGGFEGGEASPGQSGDGAEDLVIIPGGKGNGWLGQGGAGGPSNISATNARWATGGGGYGGGQGGSYATPSGGAGGQGAIAIILPLDP